MDSKSEMKIVQKITKAFSELPDTESRSRVRLYVFSWLDAQNKPAAIAATAPTSVTSPPAPAVDLTPA